MKNLYDSDMRIGEMLSVYVEQRQEVREQMKVLNFPTIPQMRALFNFGSIFATN